MPGLVDAHGVPDPAAVRELKSVPVTQDRIVHDLHPGARAGDLVFAAHRGQLRAAIVTGPGREAKSVALDLGDVVLGAYPRELLYKARHVRDSSFWKMPVGTLLGRGRKPKLDPGERSPRSHPDMFNDHTDGSILTGAEEASRRVRHQGPTTYIDDLEGADLDVRHVLPSEHAEPLRKAIRAHADEHGLDVETETLHDRDGEADVSVRMSGVTGAQAARLHHAVMRRYGGKIYRPSARKFMETGASDDGKIDSAHELVKLARAYDLTQGAMGGYPEASKHLNEVLKPLSQRERAKIVEAVGGDADSYSGYNVWAHGLTGDAADNDHRRWAAAHILRRAADRDLDLETLR